MTAYAFFTCIGGIAGFVGFGRLMLTIFKKTTFWETQYDCKSDSSGLNITLGIACVVWGIGLWVHNSQNLSFLSFLLIASLVSGCFFNAAVLLVPSKEPCETELLSIHELALKKLSKVLENPSAIITFEELSDALIDWKSAKEFLDENEYNYLKEKYSDPNCWLKTNPIYKATRKNVFELSCVIFSFYNVWSKRQLEAIVSESDVPSEFLYRYVNMFDEQLSQTDKTLEQLYDFVSARDNLYETMETFKEQYETGISVEEMESLAARGLVTQEYADEYINQIEANLITLNMLPEIKKKNEELKKQLLAEISDGRQAIFEKTLNLFLASVDK